MAQCSVWFVCCGRKCVFVSVFVMYVCVCGSPTGCVFRRVVVDRVCDARSRVWLVRGRMRRVEGFRAMRRVLEGIIASLVVLFR